MDEQTPLQEAPEKQAGRKQPRKPQASTKRVAVASKNKTSDKELAPKRKKTEKLAKKKRPGQNLTRLHDEDGDLPSAESESRTTQMTYDSYDHLAAEASSSRQTSIPKPASEGIEVPTKTKKSHKRLPKKLEPEDAAFIDDSAIENQRPARNIKRSPARRDSNVDQLEMAQYPTTRTSKRSSRSICSEQQEQNQKSPKGGKRQRLVQSEELRELQVSYNSIRPWLEKGSPRPQEAPGPELILEKNQARQKSTKKPVKRLAKTNKIKSAQKFGKSKTGKQLGKPTKSKGAKKGEKKLLKMKSPKRLKKKTGPSPKKNAIVRKKSPRKSKPKSKTPKKSKGLKK